MVQQAETIAVLDWNKDAPVQEGKTRAFLIGDAVHTAILEPEKFPLRYVSAPELDLRTKNGKKTLSDFEKKI